ncbi:EscU/YscU/HrcU family type III secretion system export apparatus switch protein [Paenisporosarcina quisquiliarum]|uniref:EscU/YscU/HrcU family type III secretion system export apparatus switch protein n=1 Tax=Paenisporosarcina quisquiliarum TaxID=365346 RepID=A0A9X3LCQ2_9BACL|nr:EscU/YscU/HrcU family type III secretion system export apparatus switch protein [Paenisporosarcina quisquiliarum]MCZ8535627.1 EscU/YscU/HrcU family type III secretion system export apparatus switch protein [Paenisporosarcina quisquiliarum]
MSEENKKIKEVVALTYKQNLENAPTVIAKGKGVIAENLIKIAQEHQIPIQEDPSLVALLGQLDINESIPEELYQAVAEVFAFIYRIDQSHGLKR